MTEPTGEAQPAPPAPEPPPSEPPEPPTPAPPPRDEPLPLHRVALRAAVCAPLTGLVTSLAALAVVLIMGGGPPNPAMVVGVIAMGSLGIGAWVALLVVSEELAQRVRLLALRPLVLAAIGLGSALFASCVVMWALAIYEGKGIDGAMHQLGKLIDDIANDPREFGEVSIITIAPFVIIGGARACWFWARRPLATGLLAVAGCLLAFLVACGFEGWPRRQEALRVLFLFTVAPLLGGFALGVGLSIERRLLAAWSRWQEHDGHG